MKSMRIWKVVALALVICGSTFVGQKTFAGIQVWSNNASTVITAPLTTGSTSMTVGSAALFPTLSNGNWFVGTLEHLVSGVVTADEIVRVTAVSGSTMTIVRAQEGTAALTWSSGDTFALLPTAGGLGQFLQQGNLFPITPQETAAGVTPINLQYNNNPHDIRRYAGWYGDGVHSDSAAWNSLGLVLKAGGDGVVPPGISYVATQVTLYAPNINAAAALYGYGVELRTNNGSTGNSISGLAVVGGGNNNSLTIYGIDCDQLDALETACFDLSGSNNSTLIDDQLLVSPSVAANGGFAGVLIDGNGGAYGYWNKVVRFKTRQNSGNPSTYAPFGVLIGGQANATTVSDSTLSSVNYGVGLYNIGNNLSNAVYIHHNAFEGVVSAIIVNGQSSSASISGLRIEDNRSESVSQAFLLLSGITQGSAVPPYLHGNYFVSSTAAYVYYNGASAVTVNTDDPTVTPGWGTPITFTGALSAGATSGTLTAAWTGLSNTYQTGFSDAEIQPVAYTNGSTAVSFPALANNVTASAYASTGASRYILNNGPSTISSISGDALQLSSASTNYGLELFLGSTRTGGLRNRTGSGAYLDTPAGLAYGSQGSLITTILKGTQAMSGTTAAVSFGVTLSGNTYQVGSLIPNLEGGPFWVTNKTTTGFTINSGGSFTGNVDWTVEQ